MLRIRFSKRGYKVLASVNFKGNFFNNKVFTSLFKAIKYIILLYYFKRRNTPGSIFILLIAIKVILKLYKTNSL